MKEMFADETSLKSDILKNNAFIMDIAYIPLRRKTIRVGSPNANIPTCWYLLRWVMQNPQRESVEYRLR